MARLVDTLLRIDLFGRQQKEVLASMPVIRADNIAAYYYAESGKDRWDISRDFPILTPPFSDFVVEIDANQAKASMERRLRENRHGDSWEPVGMPKSWAVIVSADEHDPSVPYDIFRTYAPLLGVRWQVNALLVSWPAVPGGKPFIPGGNFYCLDSNGQIMLFPDGKVATQGRWLPNQEERPEGVSEERWAAAWAEGFGMLIRPALLAICFMHCKNVVQMVKRPEAFEVKRAQRKGYRPPITYRVLEIEPMKTVLRTEGRIAEVGLQRALHICRGHFADYTEGKGLFGKVHGRFWVPAHVRGSLKEGVALKDYAVKAPKAKEA